MNVRIDYRPMQSLSELEMNVLKTLTLKPVGEKRSIFMRWLDCFSNQDCMHTTLVYDGEEIIGWAGANMHDGWNNGMIGVFIKPEYRNNGYAKRALELLLYNLKEKYPEWPEYINYESGKDKLFSPLIVKSGFIDLNNNLEEYIKRNYKAANNISD